MNRDDVIRIVKEHKSELRRLGAISLSLFGSFSRNEEKPDSDIDILLEFDKNRKFSLYDAVDLKNYLEDILGRKVDLETKAEIPHILHKVEKDAIKIF